MDKSFQFKGNTFCTLTDKGVKHSGSIGRVLDWGLLVPVSTLSESLRSVLEQDTLSAA